MRIVLYFICCLALIFCNCKSSWKYQEKYLLPTKYKLERNFPSEEGLMSTFNQYSISGRIPLDSIQLYPKNTMIERGWIVTKWHKPSLQELINLKKFFKEERPIDLNISNKIIEGIIQGKYYLSYLNSKKDPSLNSKKFSVSDWKDIYFLDLENKKLIHISYGKH